MLALVTGIIIGLVLGLTGAGGSVLAVPLLILFFGIPVQEAMGLSLAAVAASSLYGVLQHLKSRIILFLPGLILAFSGALFAPQGKFVAEYIRPDILLTGFTCLTVIIAIKMWQQATKSPEQAGVVRATEQDVAVPAEALCKLGPRGRFEFQPRCIIGLCLGGSLIGFLSGLFGVGGGFLIVPLLMYLSQINIKQAVSTSLFIITMISLSGFASYYVISDNFRWELLGRIVIGGVIGMFIGTRVSVFIAGSRLQKIFAVIILLIPIITLGNQFLK